MPTPKINLNPDDVLDWLLSSGYVEPTSTPSHPYRIAISEDDYMPYSITFLSKALSGAFSKNRLRSKNRKVWRRELYRCLDEYQIQYYDKWTRACMHWEFQDTIKKFLEQKLGIDLDQLNNYDRTHRRGGSMRYTAYFNRMKFKYGEQVAIDRFRKYYERRMKELSVDLRTKRLPNSEYK